ncbi:MAG TPA: MBL fold metallo-hydrolase [Solirubrobacteraceae bacterium]|nr:MBL fold metallo-hydrolase [Solirubrobacteraceae bacterium]
MERVTRLGFVNCYVVREEDGLTLIDTALPRSAKAILAAAGRLGAPITRILLTHAHGDHIGSLDALAAQLPGVEVLISARDARLLRKDKSLDADEPRSKIKGSVPGARTAPTRTLAPGERVGAFEVHDARGHTPGQLAFLDTRDRTLFCGDAYSTLGGVATTARANPRFPLPALATWHRATALRSARELRALDPARLAPGHGAVVDAPGAAMDAAIARAS